MNYVVDVVNRFGVRSYLGIQARAPREVMTGYMAAASYNRKEPRGRGYEREKQLSVARDKPARAPVRYLAARGFLS